MRIPLTLAGAGLALVVSSTGAFSAPQILGLMAMNEPQPLVCDGEKCAAYFSAFCLQAARDVADKGTSYRPVGGEGITLVLSTRDGGTVSLPGEEYLSFASNGGPYSVTISLPQHTLDALGATAAMVAVGPRASLVPVEEAGDPDPQTAAEIALATGPLRIAAERFLEQPGGAADAARVTGRLINALPAQGRVSASRRESLWEETVEPLAKDAMSESGLATAQEMYKSCQADVEAGFIYSLRRCLEARHDRFLEGTNVEFWESLGSS
ncbi:MAG: hypothetical protein ACE5LL_05960 [Alphaproteobacteria bacterium]